MITLEMFAVLFGKINKHDHKVNLDIKFSFEQFNFLNIYLIVGSLSMLLAGKKVENELICENVSIDFKNVNNFHQ